jgi:hypothetical protein
MLNQTDTLHTLPVVVLLDRADARLAEISVLIDAIPAKGSAPGPAGRDGLLHMADRLDYLAERARAAHAAR